MSSRGGKFSTKLRDLRKELLRREEEPDAVVVEFHRRQEEVAARPVEEPEPSVPKYDAQMELLAFDLRHDLIQEEDLPEPLAAQLESYLEAQLADAETSKLDAAQ